MTDRNVLEQLDRGTFITDGGMETTLIFHHGVELPDFASFVLLDDAEGVEALRRYFAPYIELARERGVGILLDTPTWRANADWGERLGYSPPALEDVNRRAVALLEELRAELGGEPPLVISGCVGPRGDGYRADERMSAAEAERYPQIATFADTAAETDGRLPSGQPLADAIGEVDAQTGGAAAHFMINCAHPTHFEHVLGELGPVAERIRGLRANASTKSHAELDESEELDAGDPADLAVRYRALRTALPKLTVVGGCCGTDERHVGEICRAFVA